MPAASGSGLVHIQSLDELECRRRENKELRQKNEVLESLLLQLQRSPGQAQRNAVIDAVLDVEVPTIMGPGRLWAPEQAIGGAPCPNRPAPSTTEHATDRLLTSSYDRTAKLWCAQTGACLQTFMGHTDAVMYAVFAPGGRSVLTAGNDGLAKIWSIETGECITTLDGRQGTFSSPHMQAQSNAQFHGLFTAVFSADGSRVLTSSADGGARIWRVADSTCEWAVQGHNAYMRMAVFSPSETHVMTASADHTAKLWCIKTKICEMILVGHEGCVNTAVFSDDSRLVLTSSADSTARLWSARTHRTVGDFFGHHHNVRSAVFAMPGYVLTCSADRSVKLWSMVLCTCEQTFRGHDCWVNSAVASSAGALILTASRDHTAKLWRTNTGECELTIGTLWAEHASQAQGGHVDIVTSASFAPAYKP